MQAFQLTAHGGPETLVYVPDLPAPAPDRDEVRVRVAAAGLNNTDIWSREGAYGTPHDPDARAGWLRVPLEFPRIQGGDIAGRIDAVGDCPRVAGDQCRQPVTMMPPELPADVTAHRKSAKRDGFGDIEGIEQFRQIP